MVSSISVHAWFYPISVKVWKMYPINQWQTSCSSPVITTATSHLQPCNDVDIVAVSMEPRIWSYRGTLFPGSYCSHSHREANTGREQQGLNVLTGKALEALWGGGCVRAKSHSLCLHRSSEERALNATQSHLWAFQISGSLRPLKKSEQKQAGFRLVKARCLCRQVIGSVLEWITWAIKHIFSTGNECGLFKKEHSSSLWSTHLHGQLCL